ncbi:malto-oligosyltrehalose synthase [Herbaspirillum rubrisubalbicans]|uniref:Malto-oligosyltrehalose synthase n=1 Tax=Herbaspirillum rubrisubalbicans Os34 TaxID=1235827 RepID=A0A6M3ZS26_9BURK|nr:malto-oligosyltrehalose synthase [Herbaspirillum rubrisubalbicans]QJQ01366.1 malto-oligosyltrehalose synthase [Herbaspirillum rubrisubalbicans Os34]
MPDPSACPARTARRGVPRATARLQLHRDFRFEDAAEVVDYYQRLGISHFYLSPILVARPGSSHGYDVVDTTRINPELGGEEGLRQLCQRLRAQDMGLIVDIVPNHMAVGQHNAWWQDVLRWGRHSRHADWFDIQWDSPDPALAGKVLLPFLGQPYAETLEAGELVLQFDPEQGELYVAHDEHRFPLAPQDHAVVLETAGSARLADAMAAFQAIDAGHPDQDRQAAAAREQLRQLASHAEALADIDAALAAFSGSQPHGRSALHQLLERQHYRLAYWRNAADEINWRRFFEVSELIGMKVEREEVFEAMHAELFRLYAEGLIDGLRLDHIDGLTDPAGYCQRLRARLRSLRPDHEPYLIAEKILAGDEVLPPDWTLDGTTGYEFMDQCAAVLHDAEGEPVLDELWRDMVGELPATPDQLQGHAPGELSHFATIVQQARRSFLVRNFAAEFNALTLCLHQLARSATQTRDLTLMSIRRAVAELLVHFPVYRTYATEQGMPAGQRELLARTAQLAATTLHAADHPTLHVVEGWLGGDLLLDRRDTQRRALQLRAIARFQQLTPPLTAKSMEDTAFYRYGRLLSRNEVGAEPAHLALSVAGFHQLAGRRAQQSSYSLLATATHDHKRGEDARMRLAALSEIAEEWATVLRHWHQLNAPIVAATAGAQGGIDALDQCLLYQTLVGAWPDGMRAGDDDLSALAQLAERVIQWQRKALREAKRRSDWVAPQADYEAACERFTRALLCDPGLDPRHHPFLTELEEFVRRLAPLGAINSLTQTMLKLATPGVPDFYQGSELWDLSMVDPDNRRPVDFALRERRLADAVSRPVSLRDWQSGSAKQQLIHSVLQYRRQHEALFSAGRYIPLSTHGKLARHVIAFARVWPGEETAQAAVAQTGEGWQATLVICTRLAAHLLSFEGRREEALPLVSAQAWGDTCIAIPQALSHAGKQMRRWRSVFTSGQGGLEECALAQGERGGSIAVAEILGSLPVEMLELHLA